MSRSIAVLGLGKFGSSLAESLYSLGMDLMVVDRDPERIREFSSKSTVAVCANLENEEEISVKHCYGTVGQSQTGSEEWVELCLWYDIVPGLMYSLSVYSTDLDGLDLTAVAEQVYVPVQGDD